MKFEILGVGSMLRFQWQSHSDFRVANSWRGKVHVSGCIHLTRPILPRFYSIQAKKDVSEERYLLQAVSRFGL